MAIDRQAARRRVRTITGWAAAGAAALTGGLAFGASRGDHVAKAPSTTATTPQATLPQQTEPQLPGVYQGQGFTPPSASSGPPAGMSGGS